MIGINFFHCLYGSISAGISSMLALFFLLPTAVLPDPTTAPPPNEEEDDDSGSISWEDYVKAQEMEPKTPCPEKHCSKEEQDHMNGL
jgi:hypothetical protein